MDINYYKKYEPLFGSWHIVREIGSGSFGKVFELERTDLGHTYKAALKAITIPQSHDEVKSAISDGMDKDGVTAYFRTLVNEMASEFALMSELKGHSNIVSYEDHTVIEHEEGIGWDVLIRMELLTPLVDYVSGHELSRAEIIKLGIDICKALEACRTNNIIHRDIKPENIFISNLGDFKLGDFGVAKTVEKSMVASSKKGTYTYMAPEVYSGKFYGMSVDIYSLGIVLYRYLNNNRAPFLPAYPQPISHSDKKSAMARRLGGERLPAPANADKALADIVLKACAYNPKDRFLSPTEMRLALEALPELAAEDDEDDTVAISDAPKLVSPPPKIIPGEEPANGGNGKGVKKIAFILATLIIVLFGLAIVLHAVSDEDTNEVSNAKSSPAPTEIVDPESGKESNNLSAVAAVSMADVAGVYASSYLIEPNYNFYHSPENIIDGNLESAWVEAADGVGIGETITINLTGSRMVSGFTINAGYQKNDSIYAKNARPATLKVTFSDGQTLTVKLDDLLGSQMVTFDTAVKTASISLTIESVYSGSKYTDTAISEIRLF